MKLQRKLKGRKELAALDVASSDATKMSLKERRDGRGYGTALVTVPYNAAIKMAKVVSVVVGWTRCRVRLLERKQPKCFRCQELGQLAAECKGPAKSLVRHVARRQGISPETATYRRRGSR